ncbi:hypothetical protein ACFWXK_01790 [Streptomyces sp. NPDC059070]|uniref:hypothetical protein n=1 Tax=Streptomyces sp. NPDC059070 TaxID=3346713 RepID=UPI0036C01445
MGNYARDQQDLPPLEFEAPPPECFRTLFLGEAGETTEERNARVAVAREVLTELLEQGLTDPVAREDAMYAVTLGNAAQLRSTVCAAPEADRRGQAA